MTRTINRAGLDLIEGSEGLRLHAYQDTGNVWTIGYGHTHNVKAGDTCSPTQAEQWLGEDIASAENAVEHLVTVHLSDNQYAALVDFVFNEGAGQFAHSTLLKKLNAGFYNMVPPCLKSWIFDNGKVEKGLVTRRDNEVKLWNTP